MNAMAPCFGLAVHRLLVGGYHVILLKCCTGVERRLEITVAHAG